MKTVSLRVAAAALPALAALFGVGGCDSSAPGGPLPDGALANPDPTRCIVTGEKLPAKPLTVEVQGKKYALCCKECEPSLRADPEHYHKNPGSGSMSKK